MSVSVCLPYQQKKKTIVYFKIAEIAQNTIK